MFWACPFIFRPIFASGSRLMSSPFNKSLCRSSSRSPLYFIEPTKYYSRIGNVRGVHFVVWHNESLAVGRDIVISDQVVSRTTRILRSESRKHDQRLSGGEVCCE